MIGVYFNEDINNPEFVAFAEVSQDIFSDPEALEFTAIKTAAHVFESVVFNDMYDYYDKISLNIVTQETGRETKHSCIFHMNGDLRFFIDWVKDVYKLRGC